MTVLQGALKGKKWIAGSSTNGCWLGSYEYEKQLLLQKLIKEGDIFFDIGANAGFYTLLASSLVGKRGHVYAFEPVEENLRYLREHLLLNHSDNVTVIDAAVSESSGQSTFASGPNRSMGRLSPQGQIQVQMVTIDALIAQREVARPDFIKIDVEGGELGVLKGARLTLATFKPQIFLATHGEAVHGGCCELLKSIGYRLSSLDDRSVDNSDELFASVTIQS